MKIESQCQSEAAAGKANLVPPGHGLRLRYFFFFFLSSFLLFSSIFYLLFVLVPAIPHQPRRARKVYRISHGFGMTRTYQVPSGYLAAMSCDAVLRF